MALKKYVNAKNVIGCIAGVVLLVGMILLKHPIIGFVATASLLATVWLEPGKVTSWVRVVTGSVLAWTITYTFLHIGPIYKSLSAAAPAVIWVLQLAVTLAVLGVSGYSVYRKMCYWDDEEEENRGPTETFSRVVDFRYQAKETGKETQKLEVIHNVKQGMALIRLGDKEFFLKKGEAKYLRQGSDFDIIETVDNVGIYLPVSLELRKALA